jgi:hypothetical protein
MSLFWILERHILFWVFVALETCRVSMAKTTGFSSIACSRNAIVAGAPHGLQPGHTAWLTLSLAFPHTVTGVRVVSTSTNMSKTV